jgi:drug/metabolite transporter (DMT)-like permease
MSATAVTLVLLAAVLHATWNLLVKAGDQDRLLAIAGVSAGGAMIAAAVIPAVGLPRPAAWPYMAGALAFQFAYKRLLAEAYRHGDLSRIYPLVRGLPPLAVAVLGWVVAGEALNPAQIGAVALVAGGVTALVFSSPKSPLDRRVVGTAAATAAAIAGYSLLAGLGARAAGSPHAYVSWLIALDGGIFALYIAATRGWAVLASALARPRLSVTGGACAFGAYWLVVWAFTLAPIALVAALRETSVVLAAILGAVLLKEPFGPARIAAALLIAAGLALIRLSAG